MVFSSMASSLISACLRWTLGRDQNVTDARGVGGSIWRPWLFIGKVAPPPYPMFGAE